MPATCLNNIIGIPDDCGDIAESISGFSILDLPAISYKRTSNMADEDYLTGIKLIQDKARLARLKIQNDIISFVQGNGYQVNTIKSIWQSESAIKGTLAAGTQGQYRGLVIYKKQRNCGLEKMYIPYVYVKSNVTDELTIRVEDGSVFYEFPYDAIQGQTQRVFINFTAETDEVRILLPSDTPVYSIEPNCQCNNLSKSDCVTVLGMNNYMTNKMESYGIYADVQCKCDYTFLLCQLAPQLGEALLYLTGHLIADEAVNTDRITLDTTYGKPEWSARKAEWYNMYSEKYNSLIQTLPSILPRIDKCGCIDCGNKRVANV